MKTVSIIGGGIAGLSAGIYLQKNGYQVSIYEKNSNVGGFLHSWKRKGVLIDGCLHWMFGTKEGTELNKIWKEVGGLEGTSIYHPDSFYSVTLNGKTLNFYRNLDEFEKELYSHSSGDEEEIDSLIKAIKLLNIHEPYTLKPYELLLEGEVPVDIRKMVNLKKYLSITVEDLAYKFNSEIIRFAFLEGLVYKKYSAFYLLQTLSNFMYDNASLPYGGSLLVQEKMKQKFESLGGKIYLNSEVDKIEVDVSKITKIHIKNKENVISDYYVAACDLHHIKDKLLRDKNFLNELKKYDDDKEKYSTYSFIIATFKCKNELLNQPIAQIHKVDKFKAFNKEYDVLSTRYYGYDSSLVNENNETTIQVMLTTEEIDYEYMKTLNKGEYNEEKERIGTLILTRLKDIYTGVNFELIDVVTPLTYERYINSYKGTFMTYVLPPKANQKIESSLVDGVSNLVLANQWTTLPGGTPIALLQGKFAYQLIDYIKNRE